MIYGFRGLGDDGHFAVVTAAPTLADFKALAEKASAAGAREPRSYEFLQDERLAHLMHAYLFEAEDLAEVDAFVGSLGVEIMNQVRATEQQRVMMSKELADPCDRETGDTRTIGEITGTLENDPWDRRTPEEIERRKQAAQAGKDARKRGDLTGDSFKSTGDGTAKVTDVRMTEQADGTITVDDVRAVKIDPNRKFDDPYAGKPKAGSQATGPVADIAKQLGIGGSAGNAALGDEEAGLPGESAAADPVEWNADTPLPADRADILFTTGQSEGLEDPTVMDVWAAFVPKGFWEANGDGTIPDWHMMDQLAQAYGITAKDGTLVVNGVVLEEMCENQFVLYPAGSMSEAEVITALKSFGFTHRPELLEPMPDSGAGTGAIGDSGGEDEGDGEPASQEPPYSEAIILISAEIKDEVIVLANIMGVENLQQGQGWLRSSDINNMNSLAVLLKHRGIEHQFLLAKSMEPNVPASLIVQRGQFAMYFRVDFPGMKLEDVIAILDERAVRRDSLLGRGEYDGGAYIVCTVERIALNNADFVKEAHPGVEAAVYAVHGDGDRMAPEGVTVIDPNAVPEIGPRPWDEDTSKWDALTDDERVAEIKKIRGEEFYLTGSYQMGQGSVVYLTPKTYFDANQDMWQGDLHDFVKHLLLRDMKREDTNTYRERNQDYNSVVFQLGKKGFRDSIVFRLWMNLNG